MIINQYITTRGAECMLHSLHPCNSAEAVQLRLHSLLCASSGCASAIAPR